MIAGRLDFTLVLFWTSLGVSAAVVGLFLWLMREEEPADTERSRSPGPPAEAPAEAPSPIRSSEADRSSE